VFVEKPLAVDPTGVRSVMRSAERAEAGGLALVVGTQRRHDPAYRATLRRIHDGAIGQIVAGQVFWMQEQIPITPREPGWSMTAWQIRNWLHATWLSGDIIVEQHLHNIDVANWALQAHPVRAVGVGGHQADRVPGSGDTYDHFAVEFEYPDGARVQSMCRQADGAHGRIGERIVGTRGTADAHRRIRGATDWTYAGEQPNPYRQEHADLVASIRRGRPVNEGRRAAETTLTAILGREATYTGRELTWDEVLHADQRLVPDDIDLDGGMPLPDPPVPGRTELERGPWRA
jgi:predicted dehydrogenase